MPKKSKTEPVQKSDTPPVKSTGNPELDAIILAHKENIDSINLLVIADCLASDLKYFDVSHITQRIVQAIEGAIAKCDFKNQELEDSLLTLFKLKAKTIRDLAVIKLSPEDSREAKCEPVVHSTISYILNDDLFDKEDKWLKAYIGDQNRIFVANVIKHYMELLFGQLEFSMEKNYNACEAKLFGVDKPNVTIKMMDEILKRV